MVPRPAAVTGSHEPPLAIDAVVSAGTAMIVIRGELDPATTPLLARYVAQVAELRPQHLIFEMSGVSFIDCAALRLIIGAGRFLPDGRLPVVRRPSPVVRRMLALTGLMAGCEVEDPGGSLPGSPL